MLEERGHKFCRYADDCNIYVKIKRAGLRVMENVRKFLENKLRLKVNEEKSALASPMKRNIVSILEMENIGFVCTQKVLIV